MLTGEQGWEASRGGDQSQPLTQWCTAPPQPPWAPQRPCTWVLGCSHRDKTSTLGSIRHITLQSLPSQEDMTKGVSSKGMLPFSSSVDIMGTTTLPWDSVFEDSPENMGQLWTPRGGCGSPSSLTSQGCPPASVRQYPGSFIHI